MSGGLSVTLDAASIHRLGNLIGQAGAKAPAALARAINHTGNKARTKMVRALTAQTGLKRRTLVKALRTSPASAGALTYTIRSSGGNVSLKYFGPRETAAGVSAAPWNARSVYAHSFMKAGWWPHRVVKGNWNGHVFERAGSSTNTGMDRFVKVKSGLYIPEEMVRGASAAAFDSAVASDLADRLAHELVRIIG